MVVYQVKWTSKPLRNPVAWLDATVRREADNIRRLVELGATEYYLLTSVAGTAALNRGTMDKLSERLLVHSEIFGIPIRCWWRADIDARVDCAPRELKWAYQDMLAGVDAVGLQLEMDRLPVVGRRPTMPPDGLNGGQRNEEWDGKYTAPDMPDGWPKVFVPTKDDESYEWYLEEPDNITWKYPTECTCGAVFVDSFGGFRGSWADGREYLEGAIPAGLEESDLLNPLVWHWLNLLWDVAEELVGESSAAFEARKGWFKDKRERREFVQAMESAQAEFEYLHPEDAGMLRWRKPWG
ncbi:hypothetical protein ABZV93_04420 [Actinopolymorpha sp. NPDC004070]|uniref:hypothetical protein n=1 Tax=Actinopolymorpha sp. NPDC004070 TaxID=3154548 RepID=UPI0033AAD3C6